MTKLLTVSAEGSSNPLDCSSLLFRSVSSNGNLETNDAASTKPVESKLWTICPFYV